MRYKTSRRLVVLIAVVSLALSSLLLVANVFAQETTGGLQGTVKDATGAVIRTGLEAGKRKRVLFFHRQYTDDMISDPQMIAFRLDVGVDHLKVEELGGLRPACNTPVVIIQ